MKTQVKPVNAPWPNTVFRGSWYLAIGFKAHLLKIFSTKRNYNKNSRENKCSYFATQELKYQ
ncbi:MAG: hypothetical protein PHQ75_02815 [Thermoguttaceae bacterium]|nr:hypothetical protein [Thermoguttaceae bacterium]